MFLWSLTRHPYGAEVVGVLAICQSIRLVAPSRGRVQGTKEEVAGNRTEDADDSVAGEKSIITLTYPEPKVQEQTAC